MNLSKPMMEQKIQEAIGRGDVKDWTRGLRRLFGFFPDAERSEIVVPESFYALIVQEYESQRDRIGFGLDQMANWGTGEITFQRVKITPCVDLVPCTQG